MGLLSNFILVGSYTIVDGVMMGLLIRSMGILESDILSGNLDQNFYWGRLILSCSIFLDHLI